MKNVTIRCRKCSMEIFGQMPEWRQHEMTVYEANKVECSDCRLERLQEELKEDG